MIHLNNLISQIETKQLEKTPGLPVNVPSWQNHFPVISKEGYIVVTSGVSIGKTSFTIDKFIIDQVKFVNQNKDVDCFISYFNLEETETRLNLRILGRLYYEVSNVELSLLDFLNLNGKKSALPYLEDLKNTQSLIDTFNQKVEVINHCKTARDIEDKVTDTIKKIGSKIHDRNFYYIIVIDNLKFVKKDSGKSKKETVDYLCLEFLQDVRYKYGATPIIIQHQSREGEKPQFDYKKNLIIESVKPSLSTLGETTFTQDPATLVIGLFMPYRNNIAEYPINDGYNISLFKDQIIFSEFLKARDGGTNLQSAFYVQGKIGKYTELPPAIDFKNNPNLYSNYGINVPTIKSNWQKRLEL